ncbi:hypothetical protein EDB80DRAFT_834602 [Ilyonectria destructans]|nr:hypothetical protein EDB80DRAFT_834602 [Ilyonectria destructans]
MLCIQENPAHGHMMTEAAPGEEHEQEDAAELVDVGDMLYLTVATENKWENGKTLRVRFLNGVDRVRRKMQQYTNIKFRFVDSGRAEIRINTDRSFPDYDTDFWSHVGTDRLGVAANRQTMNFAGFNDLTPEEEMARLVLDKQEAEPLGMRTGMCPGRPGALTSEARTHIPVTVVLLKPPRSEQPSLKNSTVVEMGETNVNWSSQTVIEAVWIVVSSALHPPTTALSRYGWACAWLGSFTVVASSLSPLWVASAGAKQLSRCRMQSVSSSSHATRSFAASS